MTVVETKIFYPSLHIFLSLISVSVIDRIQAILPPLAEMGADRREFSVSSAYRLVAGINDCAAVPHWVTLWKIDVPERVRLFIWQLLHGKLLTKETKYKWGRSDPYCQFCTNYVDFAIHALRDCRNCSLVWTQLVPSQARAGFFMGDLSE